MILLSCARGKAKLSSSGELYLQSLGTSWFQSIHSTTRPPSGPYVWHAGNIFKVWRLYADPNGAFIQPVIQNSCEVDRYDTFEFGLVPVPSRLYYDSPTPEKPLSGVRLAIKEIYDLKGVRTGCSVRDFLPLYSPAKESAVSIRKLIGFGAVVIGKTKTTQFASGEGSMDWVDYQCSFNPRGDGYQDTSMSSVGSAAGLASYDWVDCSLGTDTFGSILWPAAAQGLFGLRPTHKVLDTSGVLPLSRHLDTVGHFSRTVHDFFTVGKAWFNGATQHKRGLPQKILFPSAFWEPYKTAWLSPIVEIFVQDLERVLGTKRTLYDIESAWASAGLLPSNTPLKDYLATTLSTIQLYDCYHNNAKFRDDFQAVNGHPPYVNPMIRFKWSLGAQISKESYDDALARKNVFNTFLTSNVFDPDTIMLLPVGATGPSYRDTYRGSAEDAGKRMQGFGFGSISFAALGALPQVAFPIGQYVYDSRISEREEVLPAVISIVGAKGKPLPHGCAHPPPPPQPPFSSS
ncbi:amidase signature enzyme [Cadophora sp. DSE1049]|nr:amidase signature enzyme [Cadophora sp. DSE1049]